MRVVAVAAAYKAKVLCSALFVSGLDLEPDTADEVNADAYWPMRYFKARTDPEKKSVSVSLMGLSTKTATAGPRTGATLETDVKPWDATWDQINPASWDFVKTPAPLEKVVTNAFSEPDPKHLRRTRAVVIVQDGKIIAEKYAPGFTLDTPLNGWSMAKSVMGTLIGTLIVNKQLSLSDHDLLTQWRGPSDRRALITIEDLLRMRSGLRFTEIYSDPLSDVTRMLFDRPDTARFAASRPLIHPPGTHWAYASGTTNILSLIARQTLGEAEYPRWPYEVLFRPLGMSSAVFERDAAGTFVGSSFLLATARDWARFGELFRHDGVWAGQRLLPEGWVKCVTTATPQSPDLRYGAHWWLKLSKELGGQTPAAAGIPLDAFHALGHEGQCLTIIPSRSLVVVRLGLSITITAWNHASFLSQVLEALDQSS
jgi:CubicO group peptidase (beta-lactamase class C family)